MKGPPVAPYGSKLYRGYVLTLLTAVNFFYFLDRNVVLVTQELLKAEFGLSDTQLGLLVGTSYAVSFAVAGIVLGVAADRLNRRRLLAVVVMVWSSLTAFCGLASSFTHLVLARIGLAAAESGGSPATLSLLSDIYPAERRSGPASIYYSGSAIGVIASFLVGGWVAAEHGWRALFFLYGAPGLAIGLLILFTLKDPVVKQGPAPAKRAGVLKGLGGVLSQPVILTVYVGSALYTLSMGAVGSWLMSFLMRVHDVDLKVGGFIIAGALGVCGLIGTLLVGRLADTARRSGEGGPLWVVAIAALVNMAFGLAAAFSNELWLVVLCLCGWGATTIVYSGPVASVISQHAPEGSRGLAFALFAIVSNLIGAGLGPVAAGLLSDMMAGAYGDVSIRPAFAALLLVQILTAAVFALGGQICRPRPQTERVIATVRGA